MANRVAMVSRQSPKECALTEPMGFQHDRGRGHWLPEGWFVVYPHREQDLFRLEPQSFASTAEEAFEIVFRVEANKAGHPYAAGRFCSDYFDFTILRVSENDVPLMFERVYAGLERDMNTEVLTPYLQAEVRTPSKAKWGTIGEIVAEMVRRRE